jgi:hypothetical protein
VTHAVAARHSCLDLHLHIPQLPGAYDRRMWSVDRLHPGERGHRLLAGGYHDLLAGAGLPVGPRPDPEPSNPPPTTSAQGALAGDEGWLRATRHASSPCRGRG